MESADQHHPAPLAPPVQQAPGVATQLQQPQSFEYKQSTCGAFAPSYNGFAGVATGAIQICCGVAAILVSAAGNLIDTTLGNSHVGLIVGLTFFIPTGIIGVLTFRKKTCLIAFYLTLCIITSMSALVTFITGAAVAGSSINQDVCIDDVYCQEGLVGGRTACNSMLSVIGVIEMVVSIVGSSFCCGGVCCGRSMPFPEHTTVVTTRGTACLITPAPYIQTTVDSAPPYTPGTETTYQPLRR